MIQKIMDEDDKDAEITDCFYSFSNEEYDRLIENAATKRLNGIPFDGNNDIIYADIESAVHNDSTCEPVTSIRSIGFAKLSSNPVEDH